MRQTHRYVLSTAVLDRDFLAVNKSSLFQALEERGHDVFGTNSRRVPKKSDHRYRRLLRTRRERLGRGATDQRHKIASFQPIELHAVPAKPAQRLEDTDFEAVSQRARQPCNRAHCTPEVSCGSILSKKSVVSRAFHWLRGLWLDLWRSALGSALCSTDSAPT
jgi:hypothetical protein